MPLLQSLLWFTGFTASRITNCTSILAAFGSLYSAFRYIEAQSSVRRLPNQFQLNFSMSCVWRMRCLHYGNIYILSRETWLLHYTFELSIIYHLKNLKEDFTSSIWKPTTYVQLDISYFQTYPEVLLIPRLHTQCYLYLYTLSTFHLAKEYPKMKLNLNMINSVKPWLRWLVPDEGLLLLNCI